VQLAIPLLNGSSDSGSLPYVSTSQEPVQVTEEEWCCAFVRWVPAVQARCGSNVERGNMVLKREASNPQAINNVYFQGPKLGEGAFGEVFVMLHKALGVERVVKVISKDQMSTSEENVESEVAVLKNLDHPHIVRIYETFDTQDCLHIVMDHAEGGDLATLLKKVAGNGQKLSERWVRAASEQISAALEYMHSRGVIHCDLKPANTMLIAPINLQEEELPHIVLVDFGLSEIFEEKSVGGPVRVKGTPLYLAPEAFEGHLSEKTDIWAFGVMIFEMLLGYRPFEAPNPLLLWSKVARSEPKLDDLPPLAKDVVRSLLQKDPASRPTARNCRTGEWFKSRRSEEVKPADVTLKRCALGTANYFHRAAMFCIATELSMKDMKDVYQVFQMIDKSKSGRLNLEQLTEGLQMMGIDQDAKQLMTILDMDQNGYISYTEFLAGCLSTDQNLPERVVREAFDMFDLNGDGTVSKYELKVMLSGSGPLVDVLPDGLTIDEIMEEVGNDDGVITFANFKKFLEDTASQAAKQVYPVEEAEPDSPGRPRRASLSKMLEDLDLQVSQRTSEDVSFGIAPGDLEEDNTPLHRWIHAALNESEHNFAAVRSLLDFPQHHPDPGALNGNVRTITRHALAMLSLTQLLAAENPLQGRTLCNALIRGTDELEARLAGRSTPALV